MFKLIVVAALVAVVCADHINKNAQVRSLRSEHPGDGSYQFSFDTTNGIAIAESGVGGQAANGNAQWVSPEGEQVSLTWTADENGYQAQGSHIPTPPPIPAAILRSIEWIRTHPQQQQQQRLG